METSPCNGPSTSIPRGVSAETMLKLLGGPNYAQTADARRREAKARSRRIFDSHSDLHAILERHEATIQKRWMKKTKSQRQTILLKAWPNMATTHRPDFDKIRKRAWTSPEGFVTISQGYRECFMWPYINQEDLCKPKTLPLLMNARGRHNPCDFAAADGHTLRLAIWFRVVVLSGMTKDIMILNGAVGPDEYGRILATDEHPGVLDLLFSGKQFLPGKGLAILEVQERLLSFLVSCCKEILHEIPDHILASDAFPIKPPPQLRNGAEASGFYSLPIMAAEAPYRVPGHLDFGRIDSLLTAKASAIEDHLWSLREDPGYFAHTQREFTDHRYELVRDKYGMLHPVLEKSQDDIFLARVVSHFVVQGHMALEMFSELQRQAQQLRILQEKYVAVISPSRDLPKDFLRAILRFDQDLRHTALWIVRKLKRSALSSPPLRKFFVRHAESSVESHTYAIMSKPGIKLDKSEAYLISLLNSLLGPYHSKVTRGPEQDGFFVLLPIVVDELERFLGSEKEAKSLVTPHVSSLIGELSIISQCLTQLALYQPWASAFDYAILDFKDDFEDEDVDREPRFGAILDSVKDKDLRQVVTLVDVCRANFSYPIDKRRTKDNVETLRQAEASLDVFWARVDDLVQSKARDLEGTAVLRLLSQPRTIQRTPAWVDRIEKPRKTETGQATNQDVDNLYKPLSTLYFGFTSKTDDPDTPSAKKKTKTTGAPKASPTATTIDDPAEDPSALDSQPTIAVNARALKVFRTLFFNPSPTATPGEVAWTDFVHALTSVGFAAEKLYGSVWQFRPVTLSVDRNIQFHEPHPSGKIPFRDARRHGRRLNRAYGWCGDMFALKEK